MVCSLHLNTRISTDPKRKTQANHSQIHKQLPQNGKHNPLQPIRKDPRLQPAPKQAQPPISGHDVPRSLHVADGDLVDLAVGLDDAEGVGDGVGGDGCAEADEGLAREFLREGVWQREGLGGSRGVSWVGWDEKGNLLR